MVDKCSVACAEVKRVSFVVVRPINDVCITFVVLSTSVVSIGLFVFSGFVDIFTGLDVVTSKVVFRVEMIASVVKTSVGGMFSHETLTFVPVVA